MLVRFSILFSFLKNSRISLIELLSYYSDDRTADTRIKNERCHLVIHFLYAGIHDE